MTENCVSITPPSGYWLRDPANIAVSTIDTIANDAKHAIIRMAADQVVKRGDGVKRGQVIAHSGQTGNVTSPQLHFEIRKGATPVDPAQYLSGA